MVGELRQNILFYCNNYFLLISQPTPLSDCKFCETGQEPAEGESMLGPPKI